MVFIQKLANGLNIQLSTVNIYTDSNSAIGTISKDESTTKNKHFDLKILSSKDMIKSGAYKLTYVNTDQNIADIFTKTLKKTEFINKRDNLFHKKSH